MLLELHSTACERIAVSLGRPDARALSMADMRAQGLTLESIGRHYGITRERVRQILRKAGFGEVHKAFAIQRKGAKGAAKQSQREAMCFAKYGVSLDDYRAIRETGASRAYGSQKVNARRRGIEFKLTLGEWWSVWSASGKYHLRGKGIGHYCMSRIRDSGGYVVGNVHIQLCQENSREAVKKWRGKIKANRGVFCLYPGRARAWLAVVGKTRLGFFVSEEEAVAARVAYAKEHGIDHRRIGGGKGWTFLKRVKSRPYMMQGPGGARSYHATEEEAHAAYLAACAAYRKAA
jgi:hypothetical protein